MLRVLLLVVCLGVVFLGFALPFFIAGAPGLVAGAFVIVLGSALYWFVETRTAHRLQKDSTWNIFVKSGGQEEGLFGNSDSDERR